MKTLVTVALTASSGVFGYEPAQESWGRKAAATDVSVVVVRTFDKSGKPSTQGTGFFVDKNGGIVTSRHLLDNAFRVEALTVEGRVFPVGDVVAEDLLSDLVKIRATTPKDVVVRPLVVSGAAPRRGDKIMVRVSTLLFSDGVVSAVREIPDFGRVLDITAPISAVSTGSPVVNMDGEVLGVATCLMVQGEEVQLAVPPSRLAAASQAPVNLSRWQATRKEYSQDKAEKTYGQAHWFLLLDKCDKAVYLLQQVVASSPDRAAAYVQLARCCEKLGRPQDQARAIQQLIRIDPANLSRYFDLARVYGDNGYYKEVLEIVAHALRVKNDSHEAYGLIAWAHNGMGNYEEAIKACKQAISLKADYSRAHIELGVAYQRSGRKDLARSAFLQAVNIDPANSDAHLRLGMLYGEAGDRQKQVQSLGTAVRCDSQNVEALRELGRAYLYGTDSSFQASVVLLKATRTAPKDAAVAYDLGCALLKTGDLEGARSQVGVLMDLDKQKAWDLRRQIERATAARPRQ